VRKVKVPSDGAFVIGLDDRGSGHLNGADGVPLRLGGSGWSAKTVTQAIFSRSAADPVI
jgi:hypothetical protein